METADDLLQQQYQLVLSRQRAQVETSKLVATFATAVAATIVASALQASRGTVINWWASALLASCFIMTLAVIFCDRLAEPGIDSKVITHFGGNDEFVEYMIESLVESEFFNGEVVKDIRRVVTIQLGLAGATSTVAAISLLDVKA